MLSNFAQYSPQGLLPQFPGLQAAGWPQMSPGLFGQSGTNAGNVPFGHDFGQAGFGQQYPFGAQPIPLQQNPFAMNPYLQSQLPQGLFGHNPQQHIIAVLGQLAQQFAVHGALTQQIGMALHQLTQQLVAQSLQSYQGGSLFAGSPAGAGGQYFGQNPFAGPQSGYSGFNPQAQAWGTNRPQTIQ